MEGRYIILLFLMHVKHKHQVSLNISTSINMMTKRALMLFSEFTCGKFGGHCQLSSCAKFAQALTAERKKKVPRAEMTPDNPQPLARINWEGLGGPGTAPDAEEPPVGSTFFCGILLMIISDQKFWQNLKLQRVNLPALGTLQLIATASQMLRW